MKKILLILATLLIGFSTALYAATSWSSYRIMIDPGHGGTDPGASGPSAPHEATLALWCGSQLYANITGSSLNSYSKRINTTLSGTVKMTRTTNTYISLSSRKSQSVSYDPYIFCSIHLNAFNGSAKGTEVWYYWTTGNSNPLANKVYSTLMSEFGTVSGFTPTGRGVKRNGWTVITGSSSVPAILTEGLFVDNKTEWGIIKNGGTQAGFQAWANGHLKGFYNHLRTLKSDIINPFSSGTSTTDPSLSVSPTDLSFACQESGTATGKINVYQTATTAACSVTVSGTNAAMFTVDKTSIAKATNGVVTVTYKPTAIGTHTATVTFKTGSLSKTTKLTGKCTATPLSYNEKWNLSDKKGTLTSKGWDAGKVRNMTYRSGKLYLVYDHSDIKVVNAQTGADLGNLNKKDVTGGTLTLCDVKICSGKVVACNLAAKSGEALRIYVWDDEQDYPRLAMTTTNFGGATRIGDCMGWSGNWTSGKLVFGNDDGTTTRIIEYPVTNGTISTTPTVVKATTDGSTSIAASSSIRVYPGSSGYWIQGKQVFASHLDASGKREYYIDDDVRWGNALQNFTWKGNKYSLMTTFNDMEGDNWSSQTDAQKAKNYTGGRMKLLNVDDGYNKGVTIAEYPSAGLSDVVQNTNCTTQCISSITKDGDTYVSAEAWVLSTGQGIAYYLSKGSTAPTYTVNPIVPKVDTPTITASATTVNITTEEATSKTGSVTFTGANLTGNISLALSGTNASLFSIDKSSIAQSGGAASGKVTITYSPTAAGSHTATLTATSSGATSVKVTIKGTATEKPPVIDPTQFVFTKVFESSNNIPGTNDGRFSTGYGDYIYVADKSTSTIVRYNSSGARSNFASVTGLGSAISSDDVGNILVNTGFSTVGSGSNWVIIEPNGTQHTLTLTYPSGVTAARTDAVGRVLGNMMSSAGAYFCLLPSGATKGAVFHVVNGAQSGNAVAVDPGLTADATTIAQPVATQLSSVVSNPTSSFVYRKRGDKKAVVKSFTPSTSDGFDVFTLGGKTYLVEPVGTNYCDGYAIHEVGNYDDILAQKAQSLSSVSGQHFQSITARVSEDGTYATIYQNVSGELVSGYRYGMPPTGVESVASAVTEVASVYYNLQGVRVVNPTAGQIYIRVTSLSDGSVRASKVVAR